MIFLTEEPEMTSRATRIIQAEDYQRRGMSLPLDLYAALLGLGIDASQYNQPVGKVCQQDISFGGCEKYDQQADLLAQEIDDIDRELDELGFDPKDLQDESV